MDQACVQLRIDDITSLNFQVQLMESRKFTLSLRKNPELTNVVYASGSVSVEVRVAKEVASFDEDDTGNLLVFLDNIICRVTDLKAEGVELPARLVRNGISQRWFRHVQASVRDSEFGKITEDDEELLRQCMVAFGNQTYIFIYRTAQAVAVEIANFNLESQAVLIREIESMHFLNECFIAREEIERKVLQYLNAP